MITPVAVVEKTTVTIRGTYTVPIYTLESIETPAGAVTTEQLHYVQDAIDALLTFLLSGGPSLEATWEIQITMKQNGKPGKVVSSPKRKEKKSPNTTVKNYEELSSYVKRVKPDTSS